MTCNALHFRLAGATLGICACFSLACGDISGDSDDGGRGGRSGSGGRAGSAGRGGQTSQGGTGGLDERDAGPEAGVGASSGSGGSVTPPGCPEPTPIPVAGHPIVIQSVHFGRSEVVLRNASQTTQTLAGGRRGWQWCNVPDYWNISLPEGSIVLEPGGTYKFRLLREDGRLRDLYPGDDGEVNEVGIYNTTGSFMTGELMEAFVSWGTGSTLLGSRENVAVQASLWVNSERVEIEPGHAGFVITGAADRGAGFTSVPARCLPAGP